AHVSGDIPAHPSDHRGATSLEPADHIAQVLGIERGRQNRRADEIAKKDGHLASLRLRLRQGGALGRRAGGRCRACQRSDRSENPFSMAERNAQFLQIGLGHIWQDFEIDGILGKGGRVLGEPNPIKPGFYLVTVAHCRVCPQRYCYIFPLSSLQILLCARAASGHATAAPPSAASNSRRRMVTVIRPSRARCVKGTIPRHERAVFTWTPTSSLPFRRRPVGGSGGASTAGRVYRAKADAFWCQGSIGRPEEPARCSW